MTKERVRSVRLFPILVRAFIAVLCTFTYIAQLSHPSNNGPVIHSLVENRPTDERWSHTRQLLCPNRAPNSRAWPLLYHLARIELGAPLVKNVREDNAISRFFEFQSGGAAYLSPDKRHMMAYLNIWKGERY